MKSSVYGLFHNRLKIIIEVNSSIFSDNCSLNRLTGIKKCGSSPNGQLISLSLKFQHRIMGLLAQSRKYVSNRLHR